jgi:hypothetical protein
LIDSDWYKDRWPHVRLAREQKAKERFENTELGSRTCVPVGGSTGFRADFLVVDDPHDVQQVESRTIREQVIDWYDHSWFNRVNDMAKSGRLVIGQRTASNDLQSHVAKSGEYVHLNLPEEFEYHGCVTPIWKDWRKESK